MRSASRRRLARLSCGQCRHAQVSEHRFISIRLPAGAPRPGLQAGALELEARRVGAARKWPVCRSTSCISGVLMRRPRCSLLIGLGRRQPVGARLHRGAGAASEPYFAPADGWAGRAAPRAPAGPIKGCLRVYSPALVRRRRNNLFGWRRVTQLDRSQGLSVAGARLIGRGGAQMRAPNQSACRQDGARRLGGARALSAAHEPVVWREVSDPGWLAGWGEGASRQIMNMFSTGGATCFQ